MDPEVMIEPKTIVKIECSGLYLAIIFLLLQILFEKLSHEYNKYNITR